MANPIYRDWEKAGVTPGSSPYAKEVFPFPGYQEDLTSPEKKAKEEQFARTLTRGITKGIGTLASPEGVGALAKEAIKSQVTRMPFGVGILSKYLRELKDGPQPEVSFDLDWTPEGPAVTVETKTPPKLTSAMEYPKFDVRREMKFGEDGEVVSYTDWGEGKRALKGGKPRLIEHRTRAQPRHRLEGQVKGAMQGYEDLENPERLLLGLYSWEPTRQPTPREVEQLARTLPFKDDSIAYENLSPYWTERGYVEPRPKIRPTRNYSTEGWKEKLQHEFDAADREIKTRVNDRMRSGASYEDALAEAQSLAKEVKEFITSNKNEEVDRASLSKGAQEFLYGMESRGEYPYERFIVHEQTVEGIKKATESLRQAYGTGDLGSARDAIKAVEDLKKTYRDAQMWAGQPHVFQPHELMAFEDLLVSQEHRAPAGSVPLSPEAYRVQEKGSEVWGRMPDWLQGVPDALHPLAPALKSPKPWIGLPTMGYGALELQDPTIDRVALGLASKAGIDPREASQVMLRAEKHVEAGVPMPEWDFLIRPEWARKKTSLDDLGFTLEQVFEIKRLAREKGLSPEDMADKVLFGNVLPPSHLERFGMGENPLFIAVGALSRIAKELEPEISEEGFEDSGGGFARFYLESVPGWKEGNKLLADIVPDDPEHRTEHMRSLYLGEKMLGVPRQIWKKIEGGLELALSDLPAHQWTMYSYLRQNTDRASDWEGLRKVLGEAQIAADHKYPSIPGLWAKYEGRDPLSFQLTPLALLPIETPEWYHEKPSEDWFARGFEHPGAQVMQLSRFPLDALEETRNAVEQFTGPAKEEEALRHLTQTAAGFIEPPLQSFTNPRWAWENQGFLLSSLNYLMLKKPAVKVVESVLKPYLDRLTGGKPVEMEFGAVRETYKKGEYAKPTKELETGLRGALDEFEALKLEAQRTKMFDRKVAEYGIEGTFRADVVGRQYLWNPRVGKRMYVDEFKVSKETGAIYWEETIAPEPVKTPAPRQRGGKAYAEYERRMGRKPPAERPIVEKDFEFQKPEKAVPETPEAQAAMEAKWGPKAAAKPVAEPVAAPVAEAAIHEVGHIDPRHPDMQFNTVEQFLAAREQRAKWVKQRRGSLNKAIKKYRDQLVEDYEMIVNPDLSIDWTRKTGEGYKKRSYWIKRKGQETSPALAELRELTEQIKGQWNGRWTKIKILKALPVIAETALGGPVFGSLELTGLLLNKILGSRAPGPLQAWVRYMFKSPEKVVPAVVRLMEYETGLQSRRYTMQLTQMLANTPEKHWGTLSDIMHGEAAAVTVDAARINDWASKKISALETEAQRQEVRDAAGRLHERVRAVSVEKVPGTTKPLYDEAVQRVRAVRYNETARRFQVDPDVRKIASANEINNLQSMADVANEYGKNWVEETLRLTDEAIELGMFDNPDSLHRIYWPQMYENVGRLRTTFKALQKKGLSTKDLMGETNKVMLEIKRRAKEAKMQPTQAQMENRLRRLGVPIEDRAAVYGMRRGGDAFAAEALGGLFELQNAVAQRKLYRDIINLHPRLWRSRPAKGFVLVPESLKRGGTDVATFGDLTGKHVQADLWEHIRRMEEFKQDLNWFYPKMLQFWKGMRTHHHVPTLMRNIFTNKLLFEPMAGIGMHDPRNWKLWKESIGDFMKYETSKEFKISLETGVFEGTWSRVELNRAQVHELINMIYPHWRDFKKPLINVFSLGMRYSKGNLSKDLKKIIWDLPGVVYSMADDISRHTYARKRRAELKKKGYKANEAARIAADEARKKFIDYENVPGFVQFLRAPSMRPGPLLAYLMMGKPFLAFSARAVPMFYDWLKTNPIQATLWMNLHNYLTGLAYAEEGITFEEMRAFRTMLPGHMVNRHMPERGTVKAHRDENGRLVDITADWRGFGWMNPFDVAIMQSEFNDEGSAFIHLLGMFGPGDPFRRMAVDIQRTFQSQDFGPGGIKRPVWRKRMTTEGGLEFAIRATGDVLGYAYQGVMSPSLPGGSLWNQTVAAIGGLPDQYNRVQTVEQVASRWLGLFDVEDVSFRRRVGITAKKMRQAMATDDKRAASGYVKKRFGLPSYNKEALLQMEHAKSYGRLLIDQDDGKLVTPGYIIATYEIKKAQLAMPRLKKYYDTMTYLERDAAGNKKVILEAAKSPREILGMVGRIGKGVDQDLHKALMEDLQFFAKKGWKIKSDDAKDTDPGVKAALVLDMLNATKGSVGIGTLLAQTAEEVSLEEMMIKLRRLSQATAHPRAIRLIGEGKDPFKEAKDKKTLLTDPYKLDEILK